MESEHTHVQNNENRWDRLNQLIDQHLQQSEYSIDAICNDLGLSRSQLFRLVKEQTGLSPSLHIRQRRLVRAEVLLKSTEWRIGEITDKIGFDSSQTFAKYFTQKFGVSPTEYRRQQRALPEPSAADKSLEVKDQEVVTDETPVPRGRKASYLTFLGMGALLLLALGIWGYSSNSVSSTVSPEDMFTNSVAVLPFRSSADEETLLLADGLAAQVHASLSAIENLKVISRTSVELFRDSRKTIPQIAAELRVKYVLVGHLNRVGDQLRVNVELVEASQDRALWAKNYEGTDDVLMGLMMTVARQTILALNQKPTDAESRRMSRMPTSNPEALHEYLLGKQLLQARTFEKLRASIEHFDRATTLDPGFADAYAQKSAAYFILGNNFKDPRENIRLSEKNALRAIQLDGENGMAYASLASIYRLLNKWEQTITTFQIALTHSPNDAQINYWYSIALRSLGRLDEAIRYSTKALALDPLYPTIITGHIGNLSYAGKFDEAEKLFEDYQLPLSNFYPYYYVKAYYHLNRQDFRDALREFMKSDSLNPNDMSIQPCLAFCRARLGQKAAALTYLQTLPDTPDYYLAKVIVYAGLTDRTNCLKYLGLGADLGMAPDYLKVSPLFRFLQGDPHFQELLDRLGLLDPIL